MLTGQGYDGLCTRKTDKASPAFLNNVAGSVPAAIFLVAIHLCVLQHSGGQYLSGALVDTIVR